MRRPARPRIAIEIIQRQRNHGYCPLYTAILRSGNMSNALYLIFPVLTTICHLIKPGGARTMIAENLLLRRQLIIHSRSRCRAPNLTTGDRVLLGFLSLFLNPRRVARVAIIVKPSTLLFFHDALKKRKYRLLYSPWRSRKPGPKGPSKEVIKAIVEMKLRNPRYGVPSYSPTDQPGFWAGLGQRHRPTSSCYAL